jgi:hypothetical protein
LRDTTGVDHAWRLPVRPFINVHEAEGRHVEALLRLFETYQIEFPVDHWPCHITVTPTLKEVCQQAAEFEQDNMTMYDRILAETSEPDVRRVLLNLQSASRDRHLPAFERCVHRES